MTDHTQMKRLYPHFTDDEIAEAAETLDRYASLTLRIAERIANDVEALERLRSLTTTDRPLKMMDKGRTFTTSTPPS